MATGSRHDIHLRRLRSADVPRGGTTGQALLKLSEANRDTGWGTISGSVSTHFLAIWFESVASGTGGTLSAPTSGTLVADKWPEGVDALATRLDSFGQPTWQVPLTAAGSVVTATLNVSTGAWTISDTPASYPVGIVFAYTVPVDSIDHTKLLIESELIGEQPETEAGTLEDADRFPVYQSGGLRYALWSTLLTALANPDDASQAEAEAGTETANRSWSPVRIFQAIVSRLAAGFTAAFVTFDTGYTVTDSEAQGSLYWDDENRTLSLVLGNGVILQIGEELTPDFYNQTGTGWDNGVPIMFAGTIGASGKIKGQLAIADGSVPSAYFLGLTTETVANGTDGKVAVFGRVRGLNTSGSLYGETWADADIIYVSPTTAGYLTNVKPTAPNLSIIAGVVVNANGSTGTLAVNPRISYNLTALDDVYAAPDTTGQVLAWNQGSLRWEISTLSHSIADTTRHSDVPIYVDTPLPPMVLSGGNVTEGTNAGTYKIAALTALLRATDSSTGALTPVSLAEQDNQVITAADTTYIVTLNYNGGSPTLSLSTSNPYAADKRSIPIGKVFKDGSNNVHYIDGGYNFDQAAYHFHTRLKAKHNLELVSGSGIAYSGTNNFTMASGLAYGGVNPFPVAAYDSAVTTFTPVYSDGGAGFTEGTPRNTIDYARYDDGDGTLGNVGNAKEGNHWVYRHIDDGDVYVVYGLGSYSLAAAETEPEPPTPQHLTDFGVLIGRITAPQAGGSFTNISMDTDHDFGGTAVSDHAQLSNLLLAAAGVTYGHIDASAQTVAGAKTFSTFPLAPDGTPPALLSLVTAKSIQNGSVTYVPDTGAANAYAFTPEPAPTALAAGQWFVFKAANANTGPSTLNVNSLGDKNILKHSDTALVANDIKAGALVLVWYDGTSFQMLSQLGNAPSGGGAALPSVELSAEAFGYPTDNVTNYANSVDADLDRTTTALPLRWLDDSQEEPLSFPGFLQLTADMTGLTVRVSVVPASAVGDELMAFKLYMFRIVNQTAISSEIEVEFGTQALDSSGTDPEVYEKTIATASLGGVAASDMVYIALTRDVANDTFADDLGLINATVTESQA